MQRCLDLALLGEPFVAPNPLVGCVIVYNNRIVAEGYHQKYGDAHAEVNAFLNLPKAVDPRLCDVYVNLEPCAHFGKTPPCADLIIQKHPKRLIVGMLDPNPQVAGKGLERIKAAGIDISIGILQEECERLNQKFIGFHTNKRPFITLKWAETADGYMGRAADEDNKSKQISSPRNSYLVHKLRANHQGILVGAKTANSDNPLLDVRFAEGNNPIKIILSKSLSLSASSRLLQHGKTLVYTSKSSSKSENVEYIQQDIDISLRHILTDLYQRNIQSILVEGGSEILASFIDSGFWDEAIILKSEENWRQGIKAPFIGIKCKRKEQINGDTIKYFKR